MDPSKEPKDASHESMTDQSTSNKVYPYRFGEVGVMLNMLTTDQVRDSLKKQRRQQEHGLTAKLGELLIQHGALNADQVKKILNAQEKLRERQAQGDNGIASSKTVAPPSAFNLQPPVAHVDKTPAETARREQVHIKPQETRRQMLGPFELYQQLGEGSMGAVFKAFDTRNKQTVALKILPKHMAQDIEFLERFKRETKTLGVLNHPNITALYEAGLVAGYWYLTMEFVEGESVAQRLVREKRIPEPEVLEVARSVCQALSHAHALGLIHRDIKPENILIARDGSVKLSDFGLVKTSEDNSKLTAVGLSIGTPHYISPEQAMGRDQIDQRADLYGLGATLFHMLTGQVPFDHASATQVMVMHVKEPPPDPRTIVPSISRATSQLILRLLQKEPEHRFASADELIQTIERVMAGKPPEPVGNTQHGGKRRGQSNNSGKLGCLSKAALIILPVALALWWLVY